MKRVLMILLLGVFSVSAFAASEREVQGYDRTPVGHWRPKYRNLSFSKEKMVFPGDWSLSSRFGASFTAGRTYYLHRTPILRMIRIGIDATWFDINYANYKPSLSDFFDGGRGYDYGYDYDDEDEGDYVIHKGEVGMHVGPSVTVNPLGKLNVHAYFRYAPTFSMMYNDGSFFGNYASMFVSGASVSYGVIGVGIEGRWGNCKYKQFGGDDDDWYDYDGSYGGSSLSKIKNSGFRVYLAFRLGR